MSDKTSPTDAFEDAEMAREEAGEREALSLVLIRTEAAHFWTRWDNLGQYKQMGFCICGEFTHTVDGHDYASIAGGTAMARHHADAILAAGFSRQSLASTTAADAWDEGAAAIKDIVYQYEFGESNPVNPYRVAAPEGDGGNE